MRFKPAHTSLAALIAAFLAVPSASSQATRIKNHNETDSTGYNVAGTGHAEQKRSNMIQAADGAQSGNVSLWEVEGKRK